MSIDEYFNTNRQEVLGKHTFFFNAWRALGFNGIAGDYAEFGSWGGATFMMSYTESRRQRSKAHLWAIDSFQGLPPQKSPEDQHPWWKPGTLKTSVEEFHAICVKNNIPRYAYTTIEGFYEDTLDKRTASKYPDDVALAYIDCDLYSSTVSVLGFLKTLLKHGMIIAFDDYFCWSASQLSGERRAFLEFSSENDDWHFEPYHQFGWHGMSFVVEDRRLLDSIRKL